MQRKSFRVSWCSERFLQPYSYTCYNLIVKDGNRYNDELSVWESETEMQFSLSANTVFIKNGEIVEASKIEKSDNITVIKSEFETTLL